jgi:hypothetical protein
MPDKEPRIVESGPISIKLEVSQAIRMLMSDPEFSEKLQDLIREYLREKVKEKADG